MRGACPDSVMPHGCACVSGLPSQGASLSQDCLQPGQLTGLRCVMGCSLQAHCSASRADPYQTVCKSSTAGLSFAARTRAWDLGL